MTAVGGSLQSVSLNGRIFSITADADASRKIGGWENEVEANGDGTARIIKTRVPLSMEGLVLSIDESRGDAEYLQDLQNFKDFFPIAITYASGVTWMAAAIVTGEVPVSSQSSTAEISLKGPGVFTRR